MVTCHPSGFLRLPYALRADPASDPSHRKERNRTANRTAQKRYRERQKSKLQEREDMVAQLMEQVSSLKLERVRVPQVQADPAAASS